MKIRRIAIVFLVLAVLAGISALFGAFGSSSVCAKCGLHRSSTDWQIPLTSITIWESSSDHATPVSEVLQSNGSIGKHEHDWLFVHGGGNGIRCALGDGEAIVRSVRSDSVGAILEASHRFGEIEFYNRLIALTFDLKASWAVWSLGQGAPTNKFAGASEFRAWLEQEKEWFDYQVAMRQKGL